MPKLFDKLFSADKIDDMSICKAIGYVFKGTDGISLIYIIAQNMFYRFVFIPKWIRFVPFCLISKMV